MVISELCIRRPVFATVLSLLVLLVGLMSYSRLTVREYPNIDEPVVTVDTRYRGGSAEARWTHRLGRQAGDVHQFGPGVDANLPPLRCQTLQHGLVVAYKLE